eukprot:752432-Hanusia_phi.AAC.4
MEGLGQALIKDTEAGGTSYRTSKSKVSEYDPEIATPARSRDSEDTTLLISVKVPAELPTVDYSDECRGAYKEAGKGIETNRFRTSD